MRLGARGTAAQDAAFRAEGEYQDFARSGMKDFNAAFFHLVASPLIGLVLATVAAAPALIVRRLQDRWSA